MRRLMLIAAAMVFLGAAAMLSAADTKARSERGRLTYQIVMNWSGVVRGQYGRDVRVWANEMVPRFARAPIGHLRNAARARTFEEMNDALLGVPLADAKGSRAASRFLGELDKDYIFTPITPCRIADTRLAGGAVLANQTRDFLGSGASFLSQGGSDSDCGLPAAPAALVMNTTVVDPLAPGYLTVFVTGRPRPLAASLNYATGQIVNNQMIANLMNFTGQNSGFSLYSYATTHVVIDVVGYFDEAKVNFVPMDCTNATATANIDGNALSSPITAFCPENHSITSIDCNTGGDFQLATVGSVIGTNLQSGTCYIRNNSGIGRPMGASARCCRSRAY